MRTEGLTSSEMRTITSEDLPVESGRPVDNKRRLEKNERGAFRSIKRRLYEKQRPRMEDEEIKKAAETASSRGAE